ncbi:MAG: NTP transferase domain-containing protein, partial [Cytophagales bacterium]|nr:NTP transferase domain-containing protein [Armatimonadota bacterium]
TLLDRVLKALWESGRVQGPVVVVGPVAELDVGATVVEEGETGPQNMVRGLQTLSPTQQKGWALLCTCDLPLLSGESVNWLLDNAPEEADIVFPIITRQEYDAVLPGSPNTYAPVDGQEYTGGSIFLVRPAVIAQNLPLIEQVFAARKGLVPMARLGGIGLLWRFLTRTLTVEYVEQRASQLTGCRCRAARHAPPQLAADVDTMEDYQYVCQWLTDRGPRL